MKKINSFGRQMALLMAVLFKATNGKPKEHFCITDVKGFQEVIYNLKQEFPKHFGYLDDFVAGKSEKLNRMFEKMQKAELIKTEISKVNNYCYLYVNRGKVKFTDFLNKSGVSLSDIIKITDYLNKEEAYHLLYECQNPRPGSFSYAIRKEIEKMEHIPSRNDIIYNMA